MNYKNMFSLVIATSLLSCASMMGMIRIGDNVAIGAQAGARFVVIDIFEAAETGNLEELRHILQKNPAAINKRNAHGDTPLHRSAENGCLEAVVYLINHGAAVDAKTNDNDTPLHLAALEGHCEIVEYLIKNGAKIDLKGDDEETALHCAVENDHLQVVKTLLKHLLSNFTSKSSWNRAQAVLDLLAAKNKDLETALDIAQKKQRFYIIRCINEFENKAKEIQQRYLKQDILRNLKHNHKADTAFTGDFNAGWK